MIFYFLFIFYLVISLLIIRRIPFTTKSGLSSVTLTSLFIIKLSAGVLLGLISLKYYPENDYWSLNIEASKEFLHLKHQPLGFFSDLIYSPYPNKYGHFFDAVGSYWNDLRYNLLIKMVALCDLLSGGNYYINTLIFNTVSFLGLIAIFRVFHDLFPSKKPLVIVGCFLLPSFLYFSSGLQKDQVVMTALCFFCFGLYFYFIKKQQFKYLAIVILSILTLLLMRNFLIIALIPSLAGFLICSKNTHKPFYIFIGFYVGVLLLLWLFEWIFPGARPLSIIVNRQTDFLNLPKAGSQIELTPLQPQLQSFIKNLPEALQHIFFRPLLWKNKNIFSWLLSFENIIYLLLFTCYIAVGKHELIFKNSFLLFWLFFSISMFIVIGYTIPNISAIVRYKSVFLPFIITPILASLPFKT